MRRTNREARMETAEVVKVYKRKVWIEDDFTGNKHVMIQHQDGKSEPFCYCTFNYDYAHTSNSVIRQEALRMAKRLGAEEPVECKLRPIEQGDA